MMPDVSVVMITYNHERYIRQAIESVLAQKTDYSFEVVIGEDCSTDNTRAILNEYAQQFPEKINLLKREKNLGVIKNLVDVLRNCRGRYLAFLEGDDYWTSELKLQTQIDFLEQNADYAASFAGVEVIDCESGKPAFWGNVRTFDVSNYKSLITNWFIPTCTVVIRNVLTEHYLRELLRSNYVADRFFLALAVKHGMIKYIDKSFGMYRFKVPGSHSTRPMVVNCKDSLSVLAVIFDLVDDDDKDAVMCEIRFHASWAKILLDNGVYENKCPICENDLPAFIIDYNHYAYSVKKKFNMISSDAQGHICPSCNSTALERHLFMFFSRLRFFESVTNDTRILHIAPETQLRKVFEALTVNYNVLSQAEALKNDLALPLADNDYDIVICNNIFDCIADDENAMRELYRVLKKGGCAILQTSYAPAMPESFQYKGITDNQRLEHYGNANVIRIYGMDYFDKLQKAGFDISRVSHGSVFTEGEALYYGVNDKEDLIMCFKD